MGSQFIDIANGNDIGQGAQTLGERAGDVRSNLNTLVSEMEPADTDWVGSSGQSFNQAKGILNDKFNEIFNSLMLIGTGLGQNQNDVIIFESDSTDAVQTASAQVDSVLPTVTVNV